MSPITTRQQKNQEALLQLGSVISFARVSELAPSDKRATLKKLSDVNGLVRIALDNTYLDFMGVENDAEFPQACANWIKSYTGKRKTPSEGIYGVVDESVALSLNLKGTDVGLYLVERHPRFGIFENVVWRETDLLHPDERILSAHFEDTLNLKAGDLKRGVAKLFEQEVDAFAERCGSQIVIAELSKGSLEAARLMKQLGYSVLVNADTGEAAPWIRVDDFDGEEGSSPKDWTFEDSSYHLALRTREPLELTGSEVLGFYADLLSKGFYKTAPDWTKEDFSRPLEDMHSRIPSKEHYKLVDPVTALRSDSEKI